jgi:hypothetical protein
LACTEFDDSLTFSWASSISLCFILFPATRLHQLFFYPSSFDLAIYFLVYLVVLLIPIIIIIIIIIITRQTETFNVLRFSGNARSSFWHSSV